MKALQNTTSGNQGEMRVNLKGIKKVTRKLADGSKKIYYYAWVGGPLLEGEYRSAEFMASYNRAVETRKAIPQGTLFTLIAEFRSSAEFQSRSPKTKKDYSRYLRLIEDEFGDLPLRALDDKRVRGDFKEWRDGLASRPRHADYAWTVLARVLSVAKDRGRIAVNPCERGGRFYEGTRRAVTWPESTLAHYLANCRDCLKWPVMLALWTWQREGDLIRLSKKAYHNGIIRVVQSKTGKSVAIPAGEPIRAFLDSRCGAKDGVTTVLVNSDGMPWTVDGFRSSFRKELKRLKISGLRFHDLRGSGITNGVRLCMSKGEIAAISGLELKTVDNILDAHYWDRGGFAESGIAKLESGTYFGKRQENGKVESL